MEASGECGTMWKDMDGGFESCGRFVEGEWEDVDVVGEYEIMWKNM